MTRIGSLKSWRRSLLSIRITRWTQRCTSDAYILVACRTNRYCWCFVVSPSQVADIDVKSRSPVGQGRVICASIYSGPNIDYGSGPCVWIDNIDPAKVCTCVHHLRQPLRVTYLRLHVCRECLQPSNQCWSLLASKRCGTTWHSIVRCWQTLHWAS
jgi:hypothetical protein